MSDVWMSILRQGNAFHEPAGRHTACGRFLGDPEAETYPKWGAFLSAEEAVSVYNARECRLCFQPADKTDPMTGGGGHS